MLNLYIFLPGFLFFSLKDEILCVGNPWFSGPNTTFQSPKSTFSSRLKAFNARSLQRFSTCVLCNRFCVGYTKATMIHFTSLHWHKRESFLAAVFFFASRPVGEASTVLQVALLAKQAFSRREPSSWRGQGLSWSSMGPRPSALLSLLAEVPRYASHTPPIRLPYTSHTPPARSKYCFFPTFLPILEPRKPKILGFSWFAQTSYFVAENLPPNHGGGIFFEVDDPP